MSVLKQKIQYYHIFLQPVALAPIRITSTLPILEISAFALGTSKAYYMKIMHSSHILDTIIPDLILEVQIYKTIF